MGMFFQMKCPLTKSACNHKAHKNSVSKYQMNNTLNIKADVPDVWPEFLSYYFVYYEQGHIF